MFFGTTTIQNAESARFFIIHSGIFILVKLNLRFNSLDFFSILNFFFVFFIIHLFSFFVRFFLKNYSKIYLLT
jgi:hypothetical protein